LRVPRAVRYGVLIPATLAALLLAAAPALERAALAALILLDLQAGAAPSRLKERTAPPLRTAADFTLDGRHLPADRYLPADRPAVATLVLLHGLTPAGRREPRLARFAQTLARAGFTVLVPELPGMKSLAVGTEDVRDIGAALRHALDGRPDPCHAVGELAVSFAVGPALIAALEPGIRDGLAFVVAVGGYHDLGAAITYATTGFDPLAGHRGTPPAAEGRWWLLQSQTARLSHPEDRALLIALARRRLADPDAAVGDLTDRLGPEGRALHALAANRDPQRVPGLIAALPEAVRRQLEALDLARRDLSPLRARLLLIHGTGDTAIPASHSRALRARLGGDRALLFEADGLQHVDVAPGLADAWQLWRAIDQLLKTAGRPAPDCRAPATASSHSLGLPAR